MPAAAAPSSCDGRIPDSKFEVRTPNFFTRHLVKIKQMPFLVEISAYLVFLRSQAVQFSLKFELVHRHQIKFGQQSHRSDRTPSEKCEKLQKSSKNNRMSVTLCSVGGRMIMQLHRLTSTPSCNAFFSTVNLFPNPTHPRAVPKHCADALLQRSSSSAPAFKAECSFLIHCTDSFLRNDIHTVVFAARRNIRSFVHARASRITHQGTRAHYHPALQAAARRPTPHRCRHSQRILHVFQRFSQRTRSRLDH